MAAPVFMPKVTQWGAFVGGAVAGFYVGFNANVSARRDAEDRARVAEARAMKFAKAADTLLADAREAELAGLLTTYELNSSEARFSRCDEELRKIVGAQR